MESIAYPPGNNASARKPTRTSRSFGAHVSPEIRGFHADLRGDQLSTQATFEEQEPNTLHDLRTAKIEVQEPHKMKGLEPHKTEGLDPQKAHDYKETREKEGESAPVLPDHPRAPTTRPRRVIPRDKPGKGQDTSPHDQALAHAKEVAGAALEEQLRDLGGAHPAGGVDTILAAVVEVQTPVELIGALLARPACGNTPRAAWSAGVSCEWRRAVA